MNVKATKTCFLRKHLILNLFIHIMFINMGKFIANYVRKYVRTILNNIHVKTTNILMNMKLFKSALLSSAYERTFN